MNDDFRTTLSISGQNAFTDARQVRQANHRLKQAWPHAGPLPLAGVALTFRHAHFGPGIYPAGRGAGLHQHGQIHLEYILSGEFSFTTPGEEVVLLPGSGIVILPDVLHDWTCRRPGFMLGCLVDLRGSACDSFLRHLSQPDMKRLARFDSPEAMQAMAALLPVLVDRRERPWQPERAGFLLGLWLVDALAAAWPLDAWRVPARTDDRAATLCRRADEFMKASFAHSIRLADIALEVGLSVRHLNRLYRRHRGMSVGAALAGIRLQHAQDLLLTEPDLPVKTVAYRCGFSSPAYFTACYRRAFGTPPTQTRMRHE